MYTVRRPFRSRQLWVRQLDYHLLEWGEPDHARPSLVMVHGWMDVAASFQFVVDAMARDRHVLAPDWRGFGRTHSGADNFWFADYLADLDALLDQVAGDRPVDLVGHSMGGNVAMMYAGIRPPRIRRLVNLEGFGMPATQPDQAARRYAQWMDGLRQLHRGELALQTYDTLDGVARRLTRTNPRLAADKAAWLAAHWAQARTDAQGRTAWHILGEAAHKLPSALLYRADEAQAVWRCIEAPVLVVEADGTDERFWQRGYTREAFGQRLQAVRQLERAVIAEAGHMLHHDQPQALAKLLERFLDRV